MRLRAANNRLKVEHSIIEGLRRVLEDLLAATPAIQSIIPGRIRKVRDARGPVKVRVTTPTQTGWKAIALAAGARQELFITTKMTREDTERAIGEALRRHSFPVRFLSVPSRSAALLVVIRAAHLI